MGTYLVRCAIALLSTAAVGAGTAAAAVAAAPAATGPAATGRTAAAAPASRTTAAASSRADRADPAGWPSAGRDAHNTRFAAGERTIGARNVGRLTPRWVLTTAGDVLGTPTEADGTVYVTDDGSAPAFAGRLWAVRADTGHVLWSHAIADYTGYAGSGSRVSPVVYRGELLIADSIANGTSPIGTNVIAVDRASGRRIWQTQVESHPAAKITGSPVVAGGTLYMGVSSREEALAAAPGYPCCTFRGSVVALDAQTGRLKWKTVTVPAGYSGGAVWGSTPAVDRQSGLVYVGTGNNYTVPSGVCASPAQTGCTPPAGTNYADSVLALDTATGAVRWVLRTLTADMWTVLCGPSPNPACGPDFDFGSGPNLITLPSGRRLLGVGQKSGVYWALDPRTGRVVWHTQVGPGSYLGGIEWGSATDGRRIYVAIGDANGDPYQITSVAGRTTTIRGGSWAALDATTGRIRWQTADPQGAMDLGFVSTANGVVYAGSTAANGADMYALDARTGAIRWTFGSGGSVMSGAAIVAGTVYWGSGYFIASACPGEPIPAQLCPRTPAVPLPGENDKLFAFSLGESGGARG